MASSTLTTDKRWAAPARKSGMTVLGKIPKPINLPSQRLENHGLDPSVEIVPKGTLMWGSKPTPAASNAWSSASLVSPKSDGGSGSLSHINARPSSGGGTRPSTAGSENSLDSPSAWGPNSRPSTASGALPSQHFTLAANCPQSAETRPGSSQLSRFADGSADNLKRPTSHGHGFTLSTSDFPTLGSEKNSESNSQQGHSLQGRPSSSSGREAAQSEYGSSVITGAGDVISSSHYQHVNTVKTEHAYDGVTPFPATNLPREAQQAQAYPPNPYMPPPQFDSWHAPPGHPPGGIWHRGPAPRGPHRPVGPPGGFPVEPFAHYGRFPPNSVAAARHGPDLDGYHPKNEDVYHPHSHPNSYVLNQPVVSVRPVYQGPMPYDGYYGSPRPTFSHTNERDPPFMGDPHQPGILSQFPKQNDNFNPGNSQSRQGKHGTIPKEHSELDRVHEAHRGQPKILIEHLDRSEDTHAMERKIQPAPPLLPNPDGNWTDVNVRRDTRDTFGERDRVLAKSMPDQSNLPVAAGRNQSSCSENARPHPRETDDFILRKELKEDHSVVLDQQPIIEKNAALIEKIESLNNKARNVDGLNVAKPSLSKEAKLKQPKTVDPNADHVTKDVSSSAVTSDIAPASGRAASVSDSGFPVVQNLPKVRADGVIVVGLPELQVTEFGNAGKLGESACYHAYKREISSRNRRDGSAKDVLAHISGHGWKGHSTIDPLSIIDSTDAQHGNPSSENASQQLHVAAMDEMSDLPDYEAQHARMRELAVQRAKQRQQEEQERTRQQKEKALAKLEELNRRSSAEGQKNSNDALPETGDVHDKQEAGVGAATNPDTSTDESCGVVPAESLNALLLPNEPKNVALPVESKSAIASHAAGACKDPDIASSAAKNTDIEMTELVSQKSTSQSHDSSAQKQRQMGYRRRQAIPRVKIPREKSNIAESIESCRNTIETSVDAPSADPTPHEYPSTQNKKNNRHSRSKKKVDDCPVRSTSPPMVLHEHNTQTPVVISGEPNTQTPAVVVSSERQTKAPGVVISSNIVPAQGTTVTVGSITFGDVSLASVNQEWIKAPEDGHNTANSRPKPQQIKRSGKNQHGAQPVEKPHGNECVTWVPVKQPRKNEQSNVVAAPAQQSGKNISDLENVTRAKRAEMERYIPKPLSKELQNQVASVDSSGESNFDTKSHDKEVLDKSTATKAEVATELKKRVDKKTNRGHGRPHASWCRRNTDELALEANVEKHSDQRQPLEPEKQAEKQFKSEGHDAADNNSAPTQTTTNTNGQRQYPPKRNEDLNPPDDKNTSISEIKNTVAGSYPRAHWKPKSSSNIQTNPQDSNVTEEQVDSHGGRSDMDNSQASGRDGEKNAHGEHGKGDIRYEDNNLKSHSHEDTEQQQLNPALRHHGQHSGRYHRGGSVYRGRGHDAGKPSHPTNRERRKGSMHLEYQLVGSYNNLTNIQQNPRAKNEPRGI